MAVTRIKNNQITDATVVASAKLVDYSITAAKIANNLTYGSDLTITGNLTVNGQTTTIDTVSTVIEDPVIVLASNQTGTPSVDIGFIGERGSSDNVAFVWDESADEFVTAFTTDLITNTTVTIASYSNFHTNDANVGGNLAVGGNISITGNVTSLNVTGNITGGNLLTPGLISATGNITGGNLVTAGQASVTGNVSGGNINTAGQVVATGNITGGNLVTSGSLIAPSITATGNITGGNLITAGITSTGSLTASTTIDATGNITGGNVNTAGQVVATGNVNGGNVISSALVSGVTVTATGNVNGGNVISTALVSGANVTASANVTGGNLVTAGQVVATGNITGGNLTTAGITSTGSLTASTTIDATGNITGGNVNTAGQVVATGNVNGGNLVTAGITSTGSLSASTTIDATGNITGGNLITSGVTQTGTLTTTGNALVGGNLIVQGNITYINIDDLRVEDPIIILGTGPNGAPLTTDDGMDRGIYMEWYKTGLGNSWIGWDNSTGNLVAAADVEFTGNNVVNVNSYGTFQAGNLYIQTAVSTGNITGGNLNTAGQVVATGNVSGGNLVTAGQVVATGNVSGGNVNTAGNVTANYVIANSGVVGNITITDLNVGNINATGYANITGNVTGGNLNTAGQVVATGNVSGGNVNTAGQVVATGNITGGNINAVARVAAATGYFTGNVDVLGNLNATIGVVYANSGIFYGNAVTGNNAAFAGIPGFTPLGSNVVMQFAGNVNAYSQLNFQNVNNGNRASTDYIATADNGNDTSYYMDVGINSSTFDDPVNYPGFGPNDSYVHNHGGNLILNPETTGKAINFMVGGTDTTDIIGYVDTTGLVVTGNVSATTAVIGGNIVIQGSNINSNAARITINSNASDVDFSVDGDTSANVFYVDAGTGTASFGSSTQTTNAIVAFNATTSILMPVGNTAQRPGTGVLGMLRFNTIDDALETYTSGGWETVGVPVFTVISDEQFNGDGSTVAFTLGSSQTTASCIVSINGVVQLPTVAYSVSGTTLTFTEAPLSGDVIDVRQITTTTTVVAISNTGGNAVVAPNSTAAQIDITGDIVPVANNVQSLGTSSLRWSNLWLSGSTLTLGNVVMKNVAGGNTVAFYGPDGTTPATIASSSVDTTQIQSGTSAMAVVTSGGNIRANIAGSTVALITGSGMQITGDLSVTGNATLSGNILGDRIQNGTTTIDIQTINGNANITVGGTSNVAVFSTAGANISGVLGVTGNITGGNLSGTSIVGTLTTAAQTNITSVGTLDSLSVTGNITSGNTSGATLTASTAVSTPSIVHTGSNAVGNIGSSSSYFNTVFAQATSALYADLAEKYVADADYAPGTVVVFGGDKEVTVSSTDADRAVAGVVSTNPSYIMNGGLDAEFVATVALTGRVPCRVTGTVRKGDLMVSAGYGLARAEQDPKVGTVIGKALENFEGNEGVIEVVVGRF